MNKTMFTLSILGLLAFCSPAISQQDTGDTELLLQGNLSLAGSGREDDSGGAAVSVGRFLTERHQLGIALNATFSGDGDLGGSGGPFYRYNFSTGSTVPFVGASAATSIGEFELSDNVFVTLEGGVRFFLSRNTAFSVQGMTTYSFDQSKFGDGLGVLLGFSRLWDRGTAGTSD